jgi:hypothetical protein
VTSDIQAPLLHEMRAARRAELLKSFPLVVLIFSALFALAAFTRGFHFVQLIGVWFGLDWSDRAFWTAFIAVVVLFTTALMAYFCWKDYRSCQYQECLYCAKCHAVDKYDDGACPICQAPLASRETVFYTTNKSECTILRDRWKLPPCQEKRAAP